MTEISVDDENTLIQKAQSGDNESTEKIIINYKTLVRKIVRNYGFVSGDFDSDDLIQEGTIGLLKAVKDYNPTKSHVGFVVFAKLCIKSRLKDVFRMSCNAKNKMLSDAMNTQKKDSDEGDNFLDTIAINEENPCSVYTDEEEKKDFYQKIKEVLSEFQYKILELYLEGYSYKEIAEKMSASTKDIDNALSSAKNKIKKAQIFKEVK